MIAMPWPRDLLVELPRINGCRYEVQEGVLIEYPHPGVVHHRAVKQLVRQLDDQLPPGWEAWSGVELELRIDPLLDIRVPDIVVIRRELIDASALRVDAKEILLAVEVISIGTRVIDSVLKPVEYAEAGIPHYWLVDLESPRSLTAYHRADGSEIYRKAAAVTGDLAVNEPFPLRIHLGLLD